jgi:demethylmenaquinone methyltransferase / 2-methoxy-6-polyprenyl-1,4-benzoquinol methylase
VNRNDYSLPRVEPHTQLPKYYGEAAKRPAFVRALFDRTARHYDRINTVLSFGTGNWYRRQALLEAGLRPGMRVLDVATGTGLVARQAQAIAGEPGTVVGLDLSQGMLSELRRKLRIGLVQARAEQLPLAQASFDFLSMGYALRHVGDLTGTLREFHRVLKPGGKLLILEISRPSTRFKLATARNLLGRVLPCVARLATGAAAAQTLMHYYWDTIEHCVAPEVIVAAIEQAGFGEVGSRVELDLFRTYFGSKV